MFDGFMSSLKVFAKSLSSSLATRVVKFFVTLKITHPDVDEALISGHDNLRLQKAKGGLSNGTGWTGERFWRKEPCLGGIILSIPLDDARRSEPDKGAVADGDGTFFTPQKKKTTTHDQSLGSSDL